MLTYTFFPRLESGLSLTFTAMGLHDAEAMGYAALVLTEHPSADEVVVYEGDRRVGAQSRRPRQDALGHRRGPVLVVEDSYFQAEDLRDTLEDAGFGDVLCVGGVDAALASLAGQAPLLAIVDIDLGQGADFRVAEALETQGAPMLFFTAFDRPLLPRRWRHVAHCLKPIPSRHVVAAACALLGKG